MSSKQAIDREVVYHFKQEKNKNLIAYCVWPNSLLWVWRHCWRTVLHACVLTKVVGRNYHQFQSDSVFKLPRNIASAPRWVALRCKYLLGKHVPHPWAKFSEIHAVPRHCQWPRDTPLLESPVTALEIHKDSWPWWYIDNTWFVMFRGTLAVFIRLVQLRWGENYTS